MGSHCGSWAEVLGDGGPAADEVGGVGSTELVPDREQGSHPCAETPALLEGSLGTADFGWVERDG